MKIEISDALWDFIKTEGKFGETASDVLERKLGLQVKNILPLSEKEIEVTRQLDFVEPLFLVLFDTLGHGLETKKAIKRIPEFITLKDGDYQKTKDGQIKYANNVCWARQMMVNNGWILTPGQSKRGFWQLSPAGIVKAKEIQEKKSI